VRKTMSARARAAVALLGVSAGLALGLPTAAAAQPPAVSATAPAAGTAAGKAPVGADGRLDARAAAGRTSAAVVTGQVSWFSGTVAAGGTQFWTWNNANPLFAGYEVGFSPVGASTTAPCRFEVTGSRYERLSTGERRFQFDVKNTSTIACGATILLSQADGGSAGGSASPVAPGAIKEQIITIQHSIGNSPVPVVGLLPGTTGTTPTASCKFALLKAVNVSSTPGIWSYRVTTQNVGSVTCAVITTGGSVQSSIQLNFGTLAPGALSSVVWNNANPLNLVYVPLGSPFVLPLNTTCALRVVQKYYQQNVNTDGSVERKFFLTVANAGTSACVDTKFYLATLS
jgi:hypothetical protein